MLSPARLGRARRAFGREARRRGQKEATRFITIKISIIYSRDGKSLPEKPKILFPTPENPTPTATITSAAKSAAASQQGGEEASQTAAKTRTTTIIKMLAESHVRI